MAPRSRWRRAQSVQMDVTQAANIEEALNQAEAGFGPIHGVVNNAGVTATRPALEQDDWFICARHIVGMKTNENRGS